MKIILTITMSVVLVLSSLIAISTMTGTASAKLNCSEDFLKCSGGFGNGDFRGGSGGHFEIDPEENTFTESGGGGSGILPGGGGGRTVCDSDGCEENGGGSD